MGPSESDDSADEDGGARRDISQGAPDSQPPPENATGEGASGENPHRELLLDCLTNPERGVERLPFILSLLESDEREIRLLAAMTGCVVAVETDDDRVVEYLVRRMSDRLTGDQLSLELTTALDYLTSNYSEQVEHLLAELQGDLDDDMPLPEVGSFTRNYYYAREFKREGVGRTRVAGASDDENPKEVVADRQREERNQREAEGRQEQDEEGQEQDKEDERGEASTETQQPLASGSTEMGETTEPSTIAERSRFDQLYVEGQHYRGRYSTVYETLVGRDGEQRAISLRILTRPRETRKIRAFEKALGERLGDWAAVSDHRHVVRVWDWGIGPQPWVATSFTEGNLADREHAGFGTGLEIARSLTEAVSHLHQHDVVHGAIDARNVVFLDEAFAEDADEAIPLLDNVGLVHAYRDDFDVRKFLDPRFTAPEYYSDQFGRVDHMTDIYQLGAVCYYLFTGQPPYTGDFDAVRQQVLEADPPTVSTVLDDVPPEIDDILSKAMARAKIRRYETAEQFLQELRSVGTA